MSGEADAPTRREWIPRETFRQEGAVRFVKHAVLSPHEFFAFDRNENHGKAHLHEARRGVRKATLDTLLVVPGLTAWWEWKAGKNTPDDDQEEMMRRLNALGHVVGWGTTILQFWRFCKDNGVPMQPNAEFQALHYDGMVDSRIAKAEAKSPTTKARARPAGPRFLANKRMARKINAA